MDAKDADKCDDVPAIPLNPIPFQRQTGEISLMPHGVAKKTRFMQSRKKN